MSRNYGNQPPYGGSGQPPSHYQLQAAGYQQMAPGGYLTAPPGSQGLIPGAFMVPGVPVSQFNQQSAMQSLLQGQMGFQTLHGLTAGPPPVSVSSVHTGALHVGTTLSGPPPGSSNLLMQQSHQSMQGLSLGPSPTPMQLSQPSPMGGRSQGDDNSWAGSSGSTWKRDSNQWDNGAQASEGSSWNNQKSQGTDWATSSEANWNAQENNSSSTSWRGSRENSFTNNRYGDNNQFKAPPPPRGNSGGGGGDRNTQQWKGGNNKNNNSQWGAGNSSQGDRGSYGRNSGGPGGSSGGSRWNQSPSPAATAASSADLSDFGDMGAAAKNYASNDKKKKDWGGEGDDEAREPRPEDHNRYRNTHGLTVMDRAAQYAGRNPVSSVPDPYERFEDFPGITQSQLNSFYQAGFQAPTPIQAQSWPIAMQDRDLISIAKTGSGKTLAFLLPGFKKMDASGRGRAGVINCLVLAPTRELATQIQEEAEKYSEGAGYRCAVAYGGAGKRDQMRAIQGCSVLVATPGRLLDFLEGGQVDLSNVFYLVMDEADRMLDMGFEPQIRDILKKVPRKRQTLMFSATWPQEVRRLAGEFLYQPVHIQMGKPEEGLRANEDVTQHLILLRSGEDKDNELLTLFRQRFNSNQHLVLVFVARKNTCDFVANMLNRQGIRASAMHSDRTQEYREKTLANFKDGRCNVMVATDVASRGLDVKGVSAVINYDLANNTEDYVHRIGRTGRAGCKGESFTFLTRSGEDIWKAMGIVEVMQKTHQYIPPEVQELVDRQLERQQVNKERRMAENEQFQKVLMVAEKPSVAKMIAEHLSGGRFRTRKGQSRANQIFEFIKYFGPCKQRCKIMVTSVVGHIYGLNFEDGRVRDLAHLFSAKCKKIVEDTTKKLRIVEHLQELAAESDYLALWLDCDREGENIGFEVISLCNEFITYDNVYRAKFSALTSQELVSAYDNLGRPDKYAAMSVDARQELDLKIGVAFSRLMTRAYLEQAKAKFRLKDQKVISFGPCQTPTLWFCVQRDKLIKEFRPEEYFTVDVRVNIQGTNLDLKWCDGDQITQRNQLQQIEQAVRACMIGQQGATIVSVTEETKIQKKPVGLNTVTLLKACSKGLGMSPTAAMHAAEHLYTSGYISYPRTETTAYAPSFDLVGALQEQADHPSWGRVVSYLLNSGRINPPEGGRDVGDHPPITPMRAAPRDEFSKGNEWKIYDYVTRHFIATLHDDMTYRERTVVLDIGGHRFSYAWQEVTDRGFMFAMPWRLTSLKLNTPDFRIPQMREGDRVRIVDTRTHTDYTKPPDYLQESELIALMDQHGIGTDASIPQHIKNICDRHYVDVCGPSENGQRGQIIQMRPHFKKGGNNQQQQPKPTSRHMVPRPFGLAFLACFEELDKELCDPKIRAFMEEQVTKIATGETDKNEVVESTLKLFHEKFIDFRNNMAKIERFFAPKGENYGGQQMGGGVGGGFRGGRGGGDGGGFRGGRSGGDGGGFRGGRGGGEGGGNDFRRGGGRGGVSGGGDYSGGYKRHGDSSEMAQHVDENKRLRGGGFSGGNGRGGGSDSRGGRGSGDFRGGRGARGGGDFRGGRGGGGDFRGGRGGGGDSRGGRGGFQQRY